MIETLSLPRPGPPGICIPSQFSAASVLLPEEEMVRMLSCRYREMVLSTHTYTQEKNNYTYAHAHTRTPTPTHIHTRTHAHMHKHIHNHAHTPSLEAGRVAAALAAAAVRRCTARGYSWGRASRHSRAFRRACVWLHV